MSAGDDQADKAARAAAIGAAVESAYRRALEIDGDVDLAVRRAAARFVTERRQHTRERQRRENEKMLAKLDEFASDDPDAATKAARLFVDPSDPFELKVKAQHIRRLRLRRTKKTSSARPSDDP